MLARFSDGTLRDVTRQCCFSSSNDAVAKVDGNGLVVGLERGEAAILARYLEHVETCRPDVFAGRSRLQLAESAGEQLRRSTRFREAAANADRSQ